MGYTLFVQIQHELLCWPQIFWSLLYHDHYNLTILFKHGLIVNLNCACSGKELHEISKLLKFILGVQMSRIPFIKNLELWPTN